MLISRETHTTEGHLCRRCLNSAMLGHTWRNLLLGWWGQISFFVTPWFLIRNTFVFIGAHIKLSRGGEQLGDGSGSEGSSGPRPALQGATAEQKLRSYENNIRGELRSGTLPFDVAEGLVRTHGVDFDTAYEYVKKIKKDMDDPGSGSGSDFR
jgi:hypothetical protein